MLGKLLELQSCMGGLIFPTFQVSIQLKIKQILFNNWKH